MRQFEAAAAAAPRDADLQVALGVLHNLSRDFGRAEGAFRAALALRPADYSLWNKLGARPQGLCCADVERMCSWREHARKGGSCTLMMLVASRQAAKQLAIQAAVAPSTRPLIHRVWRLVHCILCQLLWPEQRPARCAGATMANGSRSAEAVAAYRKALELKPNYMRAWANMGISQANLGAYDASARYYIRALGLNPG